MGYNVEDYAHVDVGDYEHFLKHKEALTKALEKAILASLSNMTSDEIKQVSWFNCELWDFHDE